MRPRLRSDRLSPVLATAAVSALTFGCSVPPESGTQAENSSPTHQRLAGPTQALPGDRPTIGLNPDWGVETLEQFATTTGVSPGAAVSFIHMPFSETDAENVRAAADQVAGMGGVLMLTLEPHEGLEAVTEDSIAELIDLLVEVNDAEVPVMLRFAHEMNGSWYPWGMQPEAYIEAFREVAAAVREQTTGTEMIWAPNYGGGYPFVGGQYAPDPGTTDFELLDTDGDGELTQLDDPYDPFYPGDDVVDWVGMSLYHWGDSHPWGSNDLPEPEKFSDQLRGTYSGLAGDESMLPDFYELYSANRDKPLAIPETAAFVTADADPDLALEIKRQWWQQIFAEDLRSEFPQLRLINWFNWDKHEPEVDGLVRWSVSTDQDIADAFREDLPEWVAEAQDVNRAG